MVPRWTNDPYRSSLHRVRNVHSQGAPRYSIPFFYEPDYMAPIGMVPSPLTRGEAPKYPPCTIGEHLKEMYRKSYIFKPNSQDTANA